MAYEATMQGSSFSPDIPVDELIAELKREHEQSDVPNEPDALQASEP